MQAMWTKQLGLHGTNWEITAKSWRATRTRTKNEEPGRKDETPSWIETWPSATTTPRFRVIKPITALRMHYTEKNVWSFRSQTEISYWLAYEAATPYRLRTNEGLVCWCDIKADELEAVLRRLCFVSNMTDWEHTKPEHELISTYCPIQSVLTARDTARKMRNSNQKVAKLLWPLEF